MIIFFGEKRAIHKVSKEDIRDSWKTESTNEKLSFSVIVLFTL